MTMDTENITNLASLIAINTARIQEYLTKESLEGPSFDINAPKKFLIPSEAKDIEAARQAVIDASSKLRSLMLGPTDCLLSNTPDDLLSLHAIYRFNIASSFPIHGDASYSQIAAACGLEELNVRRILRHAMTKHIFKEPRKGVVAHTALSRVLAEDSQMLDWVGAVTEDIWPATTQAINALVRYPGSQEANETGFAIANHTTNSIYQELGQNPLRARRFGEAMKFYTEGTGYDLQHLVNGYPWSSIGSGTVVDVGGSTGFVSARLASSFPLLHFVVQDLPSVVQSGSQTIPPELASRVRIMAHDFLVEQPVRADIYLFRWIFHNWSDKYCVQILRSLIPALKPGARIVINDIVIAEPGVLASWPEERMRSMDLVMLAIQNSREREIEDWARLFELADSRFKFLGATQPIGSTLWILESIWEEIAG